MGFSDYAVIAAEREVRRILKSGKIPNLDRVISKYGLAGVDMLWLQDIVDTYKK